jgi:hypothetical protein
MRSIFWDVRPCSRAEVHLISACSVYSATLKMDAERPSETSLNFSPE